MSGPKLSAYELEQLRKAELERIQREIEKTNSDIQKVKSEILDQIGLCSRELDQITKQISLLSSSTLPAEDAERCHRDIMVTKEHVEKLKEYWATIIPNKSLVFDNLGEATAEKQRLLNALSEGLKLRAQILDKRSEYEHSLNVLADNLRSSLECTTYSIEEALQNIRRKAPSSFSEDMQHNTKIDDQRRNLINEIIRIKSFSFVSDEDKSRLENAAIFVESESDSSRLHEIDSKVIRELSRKYKIMESLYSTYISKLCECNALRLQMGEQEETVTIFDDVPNLNSKIDSLQREIAFRHIKMCNIAEQNEISKSIDAAMESLGYRLLGAKPASAQGNIKLYHFSDGVGIQVVHKKDGSVRMKVVGLSDCNRTPNANEEEFLYEKQEEFCEVYNEIKKSFRDHGMLQVAGTEKLFPPNKQFVQIVDAGEYSVNITTPALVRKSGVDSIRQNIRQDNKSISNGTERTSNAMPIIINKGDN